MIIVTGSTGVIGRAVTDRLKYDNIPFLPLSRETCNLSDPHALMDSAGCKPDAIIHLAAAVPSPSGFSDVQQTGFLTCQIDLAVAVSAEIWNCPVIYASGCSLYTNSDKVLVEESPLTDTLSSPYLQAKKNGEILFLDFGKAVILRIAGLIGNGLPQHYVASQFVSIAAVNGVIDVWGTGGREQNFVDIFDVAFAFVLALNAPLGTIINIAADQPTSMLSLAELVVTTLGRGSYAVNKRTDPREGEFARFDNQRARNLLKWSPSITLADSILSMGAPLL